MPTDYGYDFGSGDRRRSVPVEVPPKQRIYVLRIKGTGSVPHLNSTMWTTLADANSAKARCTCPAGSELEVAAFEINEVPM